jgi:hypothetical protein
MVQQQLGFGFHYSIQFCAGKTFLVVASHGVKLLPWICYQTTICMVNFYQ